MAKEKVTNVPIKENTPRPKKVRVLTKELPEKEALSPLKKLLQTSDVLLMLYPKNEDGYFSESIESKDEMLVYKAFKAKKEKKESLVILLDTPGGNVYSAVKIMDTLRTVYKDITIAVPQKAKSSGTMMCCGADRLVMGPISELGPLDKPMTHPDNETAHISALDIVKSIDGLLDTAEARQKKLAREINDEFDVPIQKSLALASDSIAKLISPMLCKEDGKIYNQATRLLAIAEKYGAELLTKFMLKYIEKEKLRNRIADIAVRRLVWLYPDHGFAIRRDELRDIFFIVENAEEIDYWEELWNEFEQNIGSKRGKIIKFLDV
ncbi:MAG: ATP-dependent Clp protease proteolytic subunit [bacterium]|nr:ATP-dependent Clp protease proteolytic subunit [bacterium]